MAIDGLKFVIIGPPGAGKSFVMYTLAKIFGRELLSQDDMEERALAKFALHNKYLMRKVYSYQVSLKQAIKEEYGKRWIENFRISILKNMIKRAKDNPFLLLDVNGKVGLSSHMINMLKQNGFHIIYLQMLEEEIFAHFQDNLDENNARTNIKEAYEKGEISFSDFYFR
jgi:adenylate kinase family enzyme